MKRSHLHPEGEQLSQETRQHLQERIIENTMIAVHVDPEVETLFLREHELAMILWKRENPDLYTVEGNIQENDNGERQREEQPPHISGNKHGCKKLKLFKKTRWLSLFVARLNSQKPDETMRFHPLFFRITA